MAQKTIYEYPTVRPPISQPEPARHAEPRFSWMDRDAGRVTRQQTQILRSQSDLSTTTQSTISQTQFKLYPEQYPEQYPQHNISQPSAQQFPQHHTLDQLQQHRTATQGKEDKKELKEKMEYSNDSTQHASQQYQSSKPMVIEPDENPLTPTTPRFNQKGSPRVPTTPRSPGFTLNQGLSQEAPRGGTWQHGLCSCAEPAICMTSIFCPCITYGKTQHRYNLRSQKKDPTNMLGYKTFNGACLAFGILCGFNGVLAGFQRSRLRSSYDMGPEAGDCLSDCFKGCCCCCCVVAQNEKEMKHREEDSRADLGYVAPTVMTFQMPSGR